MKIIFILSLLFALSAILIVSIGMTPVFGQLTNESIVVTTDKASYSPGETIVITGKVRDIYSGTPVSVIVESPIDELVLISQVYPNADKKFSTEMTAGGALMKTDGNYLVTVQYGTVNRSDTTTFYFDGYERPRHLETQLGGSPKLTLGVKYDSNSDKVLVYGTACTNIVDVTLRVVSPSGDSVVAIGQTAPDLQGKYSAEFSIDPTWEEVGYYTIDARQGLCNNLAHETFEIWVDRKEIGYSPSPKCGAGTYYDDITNSCKLDYVNSDNNKEDELQKQNTQLKIENKHLKNQINTLQEKLDNLQNIINEQIKVILDMFIE